MITSQRAAWEAELRSSGEVTLPVKSQATHITLGTALGLFCFGLALAIHLDHITAPLDLSGYITIPLLCAGGLFFSLGWAVNGIIMALGRDGHRVSRLGFQRLSRPFIPWGDVDDIHYAHNQVLVFTLTPDGMRRYRAAVPLRLRFPEFFWRISFRLPRHNLVLGAAPTGPEPLVGWLQDTHGSLRRF